MSPKRLGKMLKGIRETQGLTQVQLAGKAKLTQAYIAQLESGDKKNPSLEVLRRIARALGVPVTELLG